MKLSKKVAGSLVLVCVFAFGGFSAEQYTVTQIAANWSPVALNDNGLIIGWTINESDNIVRTVYWNNGVLSQLGTLGGDEGSRPWAINNSGQIAGTVYNDGSVAGYLWDNDSIMVIGGRNAVSWSINDLGQVAGWEESGTYEDQHSRAFVWNQGAISYLGDLGCTNSRAYGINNNGDVVGTSYDVPGVRHVVIWKDGEIYDIGADSGLSYEPAINNLGQVVYLDSSGDCMFWDGHLSLNLGDLIPVAMNDAGQVIGYSGTSIFVWNDENGKIDLDQLLPIGSAVTKVTDVFDINNKGQILCGGELTDGTSAIFLMTPVPEPGMMVLLGLAAVMVRRNGSLAVLRKHNLRMMVD